MVSIQILELFLLVSETRSFSETANRLGITPSGVSRKMNDLEQKLGTKLLHRTTRSVQLTEAGARLTSKLPDVLSSLDDVFAEVQELSIKPKGLLKLSAPVVFGELHLGKLVEEFRSEYPEIKVEIELSERYVDIVEQGYDMALRIGTLEDSSLMAAKLANNVRDIVASPSFQLEHGKLTSPAQLAEQPCLTFRYDFGREIWKFRKRGKLKQVSVQGPLRINNSRMLAEAAASGQGIALLPRWLTEPYLERGELVTLFDSYEVTASEFNSAVYLVYPYSKQLPAKARAFIDFSKTYLANKKWATDCQ